MERWEERRRTWHGGAGHHGVAGGDGPRRHCEGQQDTKREYDQKRGETVQGRGEIGGTVQMERKAVNL